MNRGPNFFLVGAPRCGTTTLFSYLRHHPQVFMTTPKEPGFFADDLPGVRYVPSIERYRRLFREVTESRAVVGEATVWYLFSRVAGQRIRTVAPQAKLLVLVRNPIDLVRSLHHHQLFMGWETEPDLERAWRLQEKRRQGDDIPPSCPEPETLQYGRIADLGDQLRRLLAIFPPEQVLTLVLDDLAASPSSAWETLQDFLGVHNDGRVDFPRANASRRQRSAILGRLVFQPPTVVSRLARLLESGFRRFGLRSPRYRVIRATSAPSRPAPLSPDLRCELVERFRDDVALLSQLLDRDFHHWLEPSPLTGDTGL